MRATDEKNIDGKAPTSSFLASHLSIAQRGQASLCRYGAHDLHNQLLARNSPQWFTTSHPLTSQRLDNSLPVCHVQPTLRAYAGARLNLFPSRMQIYLPKRHARRSCRCVTYDLHVQLYPEPGRSCLRGVGASIGSKRVSFQGRRTLRAAWLRWCASQSLFFSHACMHPSCEQHARRSCWRLEWYPRSTTSHHLVTVPMAHSHMHHHNANILHQSIAVLPEDMFKQHTVFTLVRVPISFILACIHPS